MDSLGDADSLWLKRAPSAEEVKDLLKEWNVGPGLSSKYNEIVFCGYGEPLERLDAVLELCRRIAETDLDVRFRVR